MNIFERILVLLDSKMKTPTMYGWFHILFLLIMISTIVLIRIKYNKLDIKTIKKILIIYSITCLILEVYKQINFSFNYDGLTTWWHYQWYAFPFQFCSVPMYIGLIAGFTKNKKIESYLLPFLGTYSLIAGLSCMIYPDTVFVTTIGINIQTMIHHGTMVIIGFLLLFNKTFNFDLKTTLKASVIFNISILSALFINITTYYLNINGGLKMFFISPFHETSLPIFNIIQTKTSYILFLLSYLLLFFIGAYMVIIVSKLFLKRGRGLIK